MSPKSKKNTPKISSKKLSDIYSLYIKELKKDPSGSMGKDSEALGLSYYKDNQEKPSHQIYNLQKKHPLIYRVLESYSSDCLREWITLTGDSEKIKYIEQRFLDLEVKDKLRQALNSALKDGESLLFLGLDSDNLSQINKSESVNKQDIKKVDYINVISRRFYYRTPRFILNPTSKSFNEQEFIIYNANKEKIHPDRLLWICNFYDADSNMGISYFDLLFECSYALNELLFGVRKSSSRLSSYFLFSDELLSAMTAEQSNGLLNDIKYQLDQESIVALETNAKMETSQLVATGFDLLKDFVFEMFTAISGVPQNILLGRAQGALASAEQDSLNFYAKVKQLQENMLRPILTKIIDFILAEKGWTKEIGDNDIEGIDFQFNSLIEENALNKLNRQNIEIDILLKLLESNIITDQDVITHSEFTQDKGLKYQSNDDAISSLESLLEGTDEEKIY